MQRFTILGIVTVLAVAAVMYGTDRETVEWALDLAKGIVE